jgi:uncharacterized SAM-binding protein YcdF (DUF218 family)
MAAGIPENVIILEDQSANTGENVVFSKTLIEERFGAQTIQSILAIGKVCSARRYLMTLERHWPGPKKSVHGVNYFGVRLEDWHTCEEFRRRVFLEFEKIPEYLKSGFLRELSWLPGYPPLADVH